MIKEMMDFLKEDQVEEVATESAVEETPAVEEVEDKEYELTPADEAAIFLAALQDACDSEDEFNELVMENAVELSLYGLIDDPEIVTEAKKIVYKQTNSMNLNREQAKAALRFAKGADSADWKAYQKFRKGMMAARERIFAKYGSKSKVEAKRVLKNAKRKAAGMPTVTGEKINEKIDKKIKEVEKDEK